MTQLSPFAQQSGSIARRRYRSAIELNNIGVKLLEQNCYDQAAETFQISAQLIQGVVLHSVHGSQTDLNGDCEELVQEAMQRLLHPKPCRNQVMIFESLMSGQDGTLKTNDAQDSSPSDVLQSILLAAPSTHVAFPVLLESNSVLEEYFFGDEQTRLPHIDCCQSTELALISEAAILFHNCALALLCQSQASENMKSDKLVQAALQSSSTSYEILSQRSFYSASHISLSMQCRELWFPSLLLVVLNTLIQVLHAAAQHERAKELYDTMVELRMHACNVSQSPVLIECSNLLAGAHAAVA